MVSEKRKTELELTLARYKQRKEQAEVALEKANAQRAQAEYPSSWDSVVSFGEKFLEKCNFQILQVEAALEGRELTEEEVDRGEALFTPRQ